MAYMYSRFSQIFFNENLTSIEFCKQLCDCSVNSCAIVLQTFEFVGVLRLMYSRFSQIFFNENLTSIELCKQLCDCSANI